MEIDLSARVLFIKNESLEKEALSYGFKVLSSSIRLAVSVFVSLVLLAWGSSVETSSVSLCFLSFLFLLYLLATIEVCSECLSSF